MSNAPDFPAVKQWITFRHRNGNRFYTIDKDSVRAAMTATDCPGIERNLKSWDEKWQERYQAFCAEQDAIEAATHPNTAP